MRTFTFPDLPPLKDFQFLTDSSGYVLTQAGQLYRFTGERTTLVATPPQFSVSHFYFRNPAHGALVGVSQAPEPPVRQGAVGAAALPLALLLWLAWRGQHRPLVRSFFFGLGMLLLCGGLLVSCTGWQQYRTPDPGSPHTMLLTHNPLGTQASPHIYLPNKGQKSFIALTDDHGSNWETQQLPTNFYPTALAPMGRNFLVGTYANEQEGPIALHGDGDIFIYGTDATRTPQLANNSKQRPYTIGVSRGITGLLVSALDSALYVFGSERMPTLPNGVMSGTPGNIYVLPASLQSPTRLINTPDTVDVESLSQARTGEIWVTMAGRKPQLRNHRLVYTALPTKRLLRFRGGQWQPVTVPPFSSFEQVAFVPGAATGYLLTATGEVLETRTDGAAWHPLASKAVRQLHPCQQGITWLQGDNQLVFYPTLAKE
ncbi:hypothetical protein [Hymenobacter actinosclerus]|uniref:Photosynthesis system II assembly factor Ycf48/Hcf136-like domain-containing protein n=1 Tax=Hymenobacter actinosclerus TaxID=82805 RepID=A0A1H9Z2D2_9BACT|nr:hypothetical protein [Hymenobacter actinosclerus]SES75511.1 hypothetical protein SAMN04487998_0176 [Hymenobacter actinosclerus]